MKYLSNTEALLLRHILLSGEVMTSSTGTFDSKVDPFSATYEALTSGTPSWSGGYKCITINGESALKYLETSQMSWGEYYNFIRGTGDFAASRIAEVLRDDKVIAGIRRRFFSKVAKTPENKAGLKSAIERNVKIVLKKAVLRDIAVDIASHMVGDPPPARSKATGQVVLNLFQTDTALKDLTRIVDTASMEEAALEESEKLVEEVFSYVLPDEKATPEIDEQIARGMAILLGKGATVEQIFTLFQHGYPSATLESEMLNRFIPLFLHSLSMVDYPIEPMKSVLAFLKNKAADYQKAKEYIEAAQTYVAAIEKNKKGQEDVCLLAVSSLVPVLKNWPNGSFVAGLQSLKASADRYSAVSQNVGPQGKQSLPGLANFAVLLGSPGVDILQIYSDRPKTYRTGDEKKDFSLFLHHVLEAANQSNAPADILEKVFPLLSKHMRGPENEAFLHDLQKVLSLLGADINTAREHIIPMLSSLFPKHGQRPTITPGEARKVLASAMVRFAATSLKPAEALLALLPILEEQMTGPQNKVVLEDVKTLLTLLKDHPSLAGAVTYLIAPLLDRSIPKKGGAPELDLAQASAIVADALYVFRTEPLTEVVQLTEDFDATCRSVTSAAINSLMKARERALEYVAGQLQLGGGASSDLAYKTAFISAIGSWLTLGGDKLNLGFLPRIRSVFFGAPGKETGPTVPSAPPPDADREALGHMLSALSRAPATDYNDTLQRARIPETVQNWGQAWHS